jgi:hypothetical protein
MGAVDILRMARSDYPNPMRARRAKSVAKTQDLLGTQGTCRMYGFGVKGPEPTRSWLLIVGVTIGAVVVIAIATGIVIVPGLVGLAIARCAINTPRGVAVADQGLLVTRESLWNASPKAVTERLPFDGLFVEIGSTKSHVRVQLGREQIWLRRNEHEILTAAARRTMHFAAAPTKV